jgi:hypothetical protein
MARAPTAGAKEGEGDDDDKMVAGGGEEGTHLL